MNEFAKNFILVIAIFLIIVGFATLFYKEPTAPKNIALTQLATDINAGNVSKSRSMERPSMLSTMITLRRYRRKKAMRR